MGHRTVSGHIRDICDTPTYAHTRDTRMRRRIHVSYLTHTCTHNRACARTQVLGQPHSNTLEELIRECQKCKDSLDDFEAWNSGKNITNSSKELDFVMDPFEPSEGWQEQDPEDWKPKHEYGGNRIPIRLQVLSVCHMRRRIHVVTKLLASSSFRLHARASSSNPTCCVSSRVPNVQVGASRPHARAPSSNPTCCCVMFVQC